MMEIIWYKVLVVVVGRLSWRLRVPEIKFPDEPESSRAMTGRDTLQVVIMALVVSGLLLVEDGQRELTNSRGGRTGQAEITCPEAPQYRHNPCLRRLCLSLSESLVVSICMGSGNGSGGLTFSGRRREG